MNKFKKNLLFAGVIFILSSLIYSINLDTSFNFDNDFARDLIEVNNIISGHLTLIGPAASIGIQTGPYYYYLFTPITFITNLNINSVLLFNALLSALAISYLAFMFYGKYGILKASIISTVLALLPVIIISARNPGNAFSYIPLLIILLTIITIKNENNNSTLLISGLLTGILVNFHYSNFLIFLPLLFFFLIRLKNKTKIFIYLSSFLFCFAPLLLFELKHHFVMTKNIFINHSYLNFTNNSQLSGSESAKKNYLDNLLFLSYKITQYLSIYPLILFLTGLIITFKKYKQKETQLFLLSISSFILLILTLRSQYIYFYTFPIIVFLAYSTGVILIKSKYYLLLLIFIVFAGALADGRAHV